MCSNSKLRVIFAGCGCVTDPFFVLRESFLLSEPVSAHTLPQVDMSQNKSGRSLSFSILYGHGAQLFLDLLEQRDVGVRTCQGDPHLAHRDADQRANLAPEFLYFRVSAHLSQGR